MKQGDRWIIFYTNGTIFSSADGTPWDAPRRSVQSIASVMEGGGDWYYIEKSEFFYYEKETSTGLAVGGWQAGGGAGRQGDGYTMYDHLMRAKYPLILFGRMLSDGAWKNVHMKVVEYCEHHKNWIFGLTDDKPTENYI